MDDNGAEQDSEDFWTLVIPECDEWAQSLATTLVASFSALPFVLTKHRDGSDARLVEVVEIVEWRLWLGANGHRLMRVAGQVKGEDGGDSGAVSSPMLAVEVDYTTRLGTARLYTADPGPGKRW